MTSRFSLTLLAALLLTGCASANKRLEQGQQLQREGRPADAAERYIQALKKDSRLDSARAGLRTAGAEAIALYMQTATDPNTQAPAAANAFLSIEDLKRRSLEVGIFLPDPAGYAESKRAAFDRAIARAVSDAPLLMAQGQYAEALTRLQRAGTSYQPAAAQEREIGATGATVMLAWGRADMAQGNFRSAYTRVDRMNELPGVATAQLDEARNIQADALRRGTRRIAVVPVWATGTVLVDLPEDALPALADAMTTDPWLSPPQFVAIFPNDQVEREVRRMGLARRTITAAEAARVGRQMGADFVVVTEVDSVHRADANVRTTRRPARTRSGVDTAYVIEEGTTRLFIRATFTAIDRDGQRWTDYQPVTATVSSSYTRIRYPGDYRTLDLRQAERDLFERSRSDGDLARSFASAMSPRLAEAVFAEVLRRVP